MNEKSDAPATAPADTPQVPEPVLSKEPETKPAKNPRRNAAGKKLAEQNRLTSEAKKNQKPPEFPADEKKDPEDPSGGVNGYCFLALEAWLSLHCTFIISERQLWLSSSEPRHPASLSQSQNQSQSVMG